MDENKLGNVFNQKNIIIRSIEDFYVVYNLLLEADYSWASVVDAADPASILKLIKAYINMGEIILTTDYMGGKELSYWRSLESFNNNTYKSKTIDYSDLRDLDEDALRLWFILQ